MPCRRWLSRPSALPVGTDNFYDTFGVSAYAYTGDWSDDCTPNYMYDVAVAPSGKVWASANTYYWPGSTCRLRFFAYAPRGNDAYAFSGADAAGAPTLRCVIPAEAGEQKDLLVASTDGLPGDHHQAVPLTFRHALTAVRFVCGDDMRPGTISFAVPRETIKEGNAVIVLKDERGQAIWSWHIWVTSADVEQTIRVKTFHAKEAYVRVFEFMPVNLGWCGMAEVEYPGLPCAARHGIHPLCGPEGGTARHGRCQRHVGRHAERLPLLLRRDEVRHGLPACTGHEDLCERKGRRLCQVRILLDSGQCLSRP